MRAGWNDRARERAGAGADGRGRRRVGRGRARAHGGAGVSRPLADWDLIARVARAVTIPVLGCGDLLEPEQILERLRTSPVAGVLVGRGILRNPWLFAQAADLLAGRAPRTVTKEDRGRFLLDYIDLLEVRTAPPAARSTPTTTRCTHDRWCNKLRALCGVLYEGIRGGRHPARRREPGAERRRPARPYRASSSGSGNTRAHADLRISVPGLPQEDVRARDEPRARGRGALHALRQRRTSSSCGRASPRPSRRMRASSRSRTRRRSAASTRTTRAASPSS